MLGYLFVGHALRALHDKDLTGFLGKGIHSLAVQPQRIFAFDGQSLFRRDADLNISTEFCTKYAESSESWQKR